MQKGVGDGRKSILFRLTEAALTAFILATVGLCGAGIYQANATHAPGWVHYLFYAVITLSLPVAAIVGYLFHVSPQRDSTETYKASQDSDF